MKELEGKKTYIVAIAMAAFTAFQVINGTMSADQITQLIEAAGLAALRGGVAKS